MTRRILAVAVLAIALSGCYHATVNTGAPGAARTETKWAHGWLYGLVPPSTVDAGAVCGGMAAQVETQVSPANVIASWLTAGIYTPMTISVTCGR